MHLGRGGCQRALAPITMTTPAIAARQALLNAQDEGAGGGEGAAGAVDAGELGVGDLALAALAAELADGLDEESLRMTGARGWVWVWRSMSK